MRREHTTPSLTPAARQPSASSAVLDTAAELPLGEVDERYPREWVALVVTRVDEHQTITHGRVLCHSPSRPKLTRAIVAHWAAEPGARVCVFFAGPRAWSTAEWGERLVQAADGLPLNAWR